MDDYEERVLNLTPHQLGYVVDDHIKRLVQSAGALRARHEEKVVGSCLGLPVVHRYAWEVDGVPRRRKGVYYVTSSRVAEILDRADILCPDTSDDGNPLRDGKGRVVAVRRWISHHDPANDF